jgi:methyl coenzyme M reductase subunit C
LEKEPSEMSEIKIVGIDKHGIITTRQDFKVNEEDYCITNQGPFEVKNIGKFRMKVRKVMGRKNPDKGIYYEP